MHEREITQEVLQQEVLDLRGQRYAPSSKTHRVLHRRDHLEEVIAGRSHHQHVPEALLRPLREPVGAAPEVLQVRREEAEHQLLDLVRVLVVFRAETLRRSAEVLLAEGLLLALQALDVPVYHREELDRVELLALVFRLHVQDVVADGDGVTGADLVPVDGEDVREVGVFHLVVTVADDLVEPALMVVADAGHDAAGHGGKQVMGC